jgi:hypothetical protein
MVELMHRIRLIHHFIIDNRHHWGVGFGVCGFQLAITGSCTGSLAVMVGINVQPQAANSTEAKGP